MKRLLRKVLVIVVLFIPLVINTDCKKQKRCGCVNKDTLFSFEGSICNVYFYDESENSTITLMRMNDYYSTYTLCNPDEIRPMLENVKYGDEMVVYGDVYWDCNYVMQASSGSYSAYSYQAYSVYVTDIKVDMYGKNKTDETLKRVE